MRALTPGTCHRTFQVSPRPASDRPLVPPPITSCPPRIALAATAACAVCSRLRHVCAGSSRHPAESRSSSCGPRLRFQLLPTPPRGDAVTFRYGAVASSGMDLHHADLTPLWTHTY